MPLVPRFQRIVRKTTFTIISLDALLGPTLVAGQIPEHAKQAPPILEHIAKGWDEVTRSIESCRTPADPKIGGKAVLYVPADFVAPEKVRRLKEKCGIELRALPAVIHGAGELVNTKFDPQGLLYLPNRYVVPGGRFNEMYGWDSYFIIRGL